MNVFTIWLAASKPRYWFYYAIMATVGSLVGGYITYFLAREGGKEALERKLKKKKAEAIYRRFERWGIGAAAVPAMMPPPFPIVPFLVAAGALQFPPKRFLGALAVGRGVRFAIIAWLGSKYGTAITQFFSRYYKPTLFVLALLMGILAVGEYFRLRKSEKALAPETSDSKSVASMSQMRRTTPQPLRGVVHRNPSIPLNPMGEFSNTDVKETSSSPARIPGEQHGLFHQVLQLLEDSEIPYAVAGAFALQAHTGICRDTKDLDVFLTAESARLALTHLETQGFTCEICDPVWLHKVHRNGFFVDLITGMSNAVLIVDQSWIDRAQPADVLGVRSRVLGPEELLASKLFVTRRERFDGADIAHIIFGTRGTLDWNRLLSLVGEHWEILFWALILFHYAYPAQTDYVPESTWRTLTERFQDSIRRPDPAARFRGSLIDDKMFAIDVKEWGLDNLFLDFRNRRLRSASHTSEAR